MKGLQILFDSIISLVCPASCIHCKQPLTREWKLLCASCFQSLELLSFSNRCPYCFNEQESGFNKPCPICLHSERFCDYKAACFEYEGASMSLVKEFKFYDHPALATSLAGFLFLQFTQLRWPLPDIVTSVPTSFMRRSMRGYNQSELLAKELAKKLFKPFATLLTKTENSLSQTKLERDKRKQIKKDLFQLQKKISLENKTILLIDDVCTTGATLEACGEALLEGYPKRIYALSLCYTTL